MAIEMYRNIILHELYESAYLARMGYSYESFSKKPQHALAMAGQEDAPAIIATDFRPLLPRQVQLRMEFEDQCRIEGHDVIRIHGKLPEVRIAA